MSAAVDLPSPSSLSAPERAERVAFAGIEWLRLVACLGIVAFHQHTPGERIGHAGLPVFAMLTAAMAARSARGRDWVAFRGGRLRRLLMPWVAWSAFYAVVQVTLAAIAKQPVWSRFDLPMLVMGTYPHLWYLPFAAVLALLVGRFGNRGSALAWLVAGAVALPGCAAVTRSGLPIPVLLWIYVLPGALLGTGLARVPLGGGLRGGPFAFLTAGVCGCLAAWLLGLDAALIEYAVAVPATALAWALPWRAGRATLRLAAVTLGIYILHPFVAMLFVLLAISAGFQFTDATFLGSVFVGSMLSTMLLRATPARAVL